MRLALVFGTRTELIALAPVARACASLGMDCALVHTGQQAAPLLAGSLFDALKLPSPAYELAISQSNPVDQLGAIRDRSAAVLGLEEPDWLIVHGRTRSALGAALAARDAGVPVAHTGAGMRSYATDSEEESNGRSIDHVSELLFAASPQARDALLAEGIAANRIYCSGSTVIDELERQLPTLEPAAALRRHGLSRGDFALLTLHRAEALGDRLRLAATLETAVAAASALPARLVAPLHPRTAARMETLGLALPGDTLVLPPLPYLELMALHTCARMLITDSGTLEEEAAHLGVPCIALREASERPEAQSCGASHLVGCDPARARAAVRNFLAHPESWTPPFGDAKAGLRIAEALAREAKIA